MTLQAREMLSSKNLYRTFNFHTKNIIINHIPLYLRKSMNKLLCASNYHLLINKLGRKFYIYFEITRFKDATLPPFECTFRVMCVAV